MKAVVKLRVFPVALAITGFLLLAGLAKSTALELADSPVDQTVLVGDRATFTVEPRVPGLAFQWFRHAGLEVTELKGESNSSLTLSKVAVADVGFYYCRLTFGDVFSHSRPAALYVQTKAASLQTDTSLLKLGSPQTMSLLDDSSFTIFGPVVGSSGTSGNCPGSYAGYVHFSKTVAQGWGWAPSTNTTVHTATDENRSDTKVVYIGRWGDQDCAPTTVTVPDPALSPTYRFAIYFPTNVPQTNAYPITLSGFDP